MTTTRCCREDELNYIAPKDVRQKWFTDALNYCWFGNIWAISAIDRFPADYWTGVLSGRFPNWSKGARMQKEDVDRSHYYYYCYIDRFGDKTIKLMCDCCRRNSPEEVTIDNTLAVIFILPLNHQRFCGRISYFSHYFSFSLVISLNEIIHMWCFFWGPSASFTTTK